MALDINALKAAFSKKAETNENAGFWDRFFPFYKIQFDEVAVFRFLPDLDDNNPLGFIVENVYHEFLVNGKKKKLACSKMYGETCACCEVSSKYYNEGDTKLGKTFWRKKDYLAEGLIISTPFEYPIKDDENPVRLVSLSKQLYEKLETEIVKGDLENMPTDMEAGYNFRFMKSKKFIPQDGKPPKEVANYTDSAFARAASPIPPELLARVELYDLKNFRFVKIEREQMEAQIEACLTGKSYEEEKKAPEGTTGSTTLDAKLSEAKPVQEAAAVVAAAKADTPAPTPTVASSADGKKLTPQEILARIKAQRQAAAAGN